MRKFRRLIFLSALSAAATAANADVRYSFNALTSFDGSFTGSFVYIAPNFITLNVIVPAASLAACSVTSTTGLTCGSQRIFPDSSSLFNPPSDSNDAIGFGLSSGGFYYYYFANGVFGTPGVYNSVFGPSQAGTLQITVVPEPAPAAMMMSGLVLLALGRRWLRPANKWTAATAAG